MSYFLYKQNNVSGRGGGGFNIEVHGDGNAWPRTDEKEKCGVAVFCASCSQISMNVAEFEKHL